MNASVKRRKEKLSSVYKILMTRYNYSLWSVAMNIRIEKGNENNLLCIAFLAIDT